MMYCWFFFCFSRDCDKENVMTQHIYDVKMNSLVLEARQRRFDVLFSYWDDSYFNENGRFPLRMSETSESEQIRRRNTDALFFNFWLNATGCRDVLLFLWFNTTFQNQWLFFLSTLDFQSISRFRFYLFNSFKEVECVLICLNLCE